MMTIVPLAPEHVDDVARLHCAHLTGLVAKLGPRAARAFYRGCAESALSIGLIAVDGGTVRGFVLGSADAAGLRRDVVRRNGWGMLLGTCAGIVTHPTTLAWLLQLFRGPDPASYDASAAELTYLAVASEARGGGVGRQLVDAFARTLREKGVSAFELSVDADNVQAIRFYENLGMRRIGQYREFGALHARYRREGDGPDQS